MPGNTIDINLGWRTYCVGDSEMKGLLKSLKKYKRIKSSPGAGPLSLAAKPLPAWQRCLNMIEYGRIGALLEFTAKALIVFYLAKALGFGG